MADRRRGDQWIGSADGPPNAFELSIDPSGDHNTSEKMSVSRTLWGNSGIRCPQGISLSRLHRLAAHLVDHLPVASKHAQDPPAVPFSDAAGQIPHHALDEVQPGRWG